MFRSVADFFVHSGGWGGGVERTQASGVAGPSTDRGQGVQLSRGMSFLLVYDEGWEWICLT